MNFCFYSKYNGKSTIEQLRRVTFLFPPRNFILSITHCRSFASNNSSSICSANHLYSGRATLLKSSSYSSYSLICSMFLLSSMKKAANHYRLTALCLLFNYKCLSVSLAPYIKRRTSITSSITT